MYNPGNAVLVMNAGGSGCGGLTHTGFATLQTPDKTILDNVIVNCQFQPSSTGITFNNASAKDEWSDVSVTGCGSSAGGGGVQFGDQFAHIRNLSLQQNWINLRMEAGSTNSNTFYDLKTQSPYSGVNVLMMPLSAPGGSTQGDNVFINHQCQNGIVACVAMIATSFGGTSASWYGMAPELNNGTGSLTVNGVTIPHSGAFYISGAGASAYINGPYISDAIASPDFNVVSNGLLTFTDMQGAYGSQFGAFVNTDSTGSVNINGVWINTGTVSGVASWPTSISGGRGALGGSPVSYLNPTIPNAFAGNPLTPAFSSTTGTTSNTTATDPVYGLVNTVTFAALAGSNSNNLITINNTIPSQASTSDYMFSVLVKASVNTNVELLCFYSGGGLGFDFTPLPLYAGQWTRVVGYTYDVGASLPCQLQMWPTDSAGATVSLTRLESLATASSGTAITPQSSAQTRSLILQSGAVGTNSQSSVQLGPAGACSAPTYSFYGASATGMYLDIDGNLDFCRQNFGVFQVAATGIFLPVAAASHINTASANTDLAGTITITNPATTASVGFTTNYVNAPNCSGSPTSDTTSEGAWWITSSASAVTAAVHTTPASSVSFHYICIAAVN
jgi:hypothetical protein